MTNTTATASKNEDRIEALKAAIRHINKQIHLIESEIKSLQDEREELVTERVELVDKLEALSETE